MFYWQHVADGRPLALVTVLKTDGSTYSKAGSQMLVNADGDFHGMLSGGCLEGDLAERAKSVIATGVAEEVTYDLIADDAVFGLGVGCEGVIYIFIQALNPRNAYQPFAGLIEELNSSSFAELTLLNVESEIGVARVRAPIRLLILGAGLDADPIVQFGATLGWEIAVSDHRPAAIARMQSSEAASTDCVPADELGNHFDLDRFDAVIIKSHNLEADRKYLSVIADSNVAFIGLLGPPHRRDRLLGEIGDKADRLADRLRSPVGKRIGGRGPAAIALEVVAELQACFSADD